MPQPELESAQQSNNAFRQATSSLLAQGAHAKRNLSEEQYLALASAVWSTCEKDEVYAVKLLIDPVSQPQFREEASDNLFCVLVARIGHRGELIDAPPGYVPPNYPGVKLSHVVVGSPSSGHEPDASQPQTYILAFMDVLGFEALLERVGLAEVHARYTLLLDQALRPQSHENQWSRAKSVVRGEVVPALMWLPVRAAHFSDSLLLWVHYHPGHVEEFLTRCSRVFCKALDLGIPLRGAVTVGDAVLDNDANVFLGKPLVEAARLESKQDWVGVALGVSFKSKNLRIPISPEKIRIHTPPLKDGGAMLFSDLVLDWPRVWNSEYSLSATEKLSSLSEVAPTEPLKARYAAACKFYEASSGSLDWFIPPGFTKEA